MNTPQQAVAAAALALISGTHIASANEVAITGSLVLTQQDADAAHIRHETAASADLMLTQQKNAHGWFIHVEATTSLQPGHVASMLPEANGDAGSALDKDGKGRLQLSELYYQYSFADKQVVSAGLIDISGFFEQSRIASDESTQFLGASFTGNPIIEFPDYTLGIVYEHELAAGPVVRGAISSSNGIADNSARSYSQLLSVTDKEKGLFAITSISWNSPAHLLRLGVWTNTAEHRVIGSDSRSEDNYGVYLLAGYRQGPHGWNLRLGLANENVSRASGFTSLGYQFHSGDYVLGAGAARAYLSAQESNPLLDNSNQYELYLRYALSDGMFVTADVQRIYNSDFGEIADNRNTAVHVYGVRLTLLLG
jgi:porin